MSDLDHLILSTSARIAARATDDELLQIAQQAGIDPAVFAERGMFFWRNEISSNRLDSHYTRMDPDTTLANFAADAAAGRAFLAGHNHRSLPFGKTLTGTLDRSGDTVRVLADAYTLPGLELGGVRTDDFIAGVRAGILSDVSVGFGLQGAEIRCDICGRDMLRDWDCYHIPGFESTDKINGETRTQIATGTVIGARLSEVSVVYDGSTPGAAIVKAQQEAEHGRIKPEQARILAVRYPDLQLPEKRFQVPVANVPNGTATYQWVRPVMPVSTLPTTTSYTIRVGTSSAPLQEHSPMADDVTVEQAVDARSLEQAEPVADATPETEAVRTSEPTVTVNLETVPSETVRTLFAAAGIEATTLFAGIEAMAQRIIELIPLADDGRAYRSDLIDQALKEGVRAYGADFAADVYRPVLERAEIATITRMRDDWQLIAAKTFSAGRQTVDDDQTPTSAAKPAAPTPRETPDSAFRA